VAGNAQYEERFGHVFLICATGLSGADMLAALRERLDNDPRTERSVATRELRSITVLRARKLVGA
jgi:2-oxo-4-hydroxy-4-carboxy-5-ureidoimidazoline decarboxylase